MDEGREREREGMAPRHRSIGGVSPSQHCRLSFLIFIEKRLIPCKREKKTKRKEGKSQRPKAKGGQLHNCSRKSSYACCVGVYEQLRSTSAPLNVERTQTEWQSRNEHEGKWRRVEKDCSPAWFALCMLECHPATDQMLASPWNCFMFG